VKICVCGWYFREQFLRDLSLSDYETFVIKHRDGNTHGLRHVRYSNHGLEFGAYRQYVRNHWDGESDVLFLHDDTEITDLQALKDIETLNEMGVDQAYIFQDEMHEYVNGGAHGRGIWIRGSLLKQLAEDFPADMDNLGVNVGVVAQKGILAFHKRVMELSKNAGVIAIVPQIRFAHRGRLHDKMFVYRPNSTVPGGIVATA
jgi:hypothetical protein